MRTDYFDDLLADVVTPVTPARKQGVTSGKREKPRNYADSAPLLHLLHPLHPETGNAEHDAEIWEHLEERAGIQEHDGGLSRPEAEREARRNLRVFKYRLTDNPDGELVFISPGSSLEQATARLRRQFGEDRVIEVRTHYSGDTTNE